MTQPILEQAAGEVLGIEANGGRSRRAVFAGAVAVISLAIFILFRPQGEEPPLREEPVAEAIAVPKEPIPVEPMSVEAPPAEAVKAETVPDAQTPAAAAEARVEAKADVPAERSRDLDWLFGQAREGTREHAAGVLFAAWGLPPPGAGPVEEMCATLGEEGLRCLSASGGLDDLRRLNRPAVLRLHDAGGTSFYAALTAADEERVTLVFKGGSGEVEFRWFGSYTLIWRPPPGYEKPLVPGRRSPVTGWMRERLEEADESPGDGESDLYDPDLVEAVRRFQQSRGLEADGIVGPLTLIHLSSDRNEGVPLLTTGKGKG